MLYLLLSILGVLDLLLLTPASFCGILSAPLWGSANPPKGQGGSRLQREVGQLDMWIAASR